MVRVTFVEPGGAARSEELPEGWTLMQAAVARGVEGIVADCGGSCSCGTCHVYVDPADLARLPPPDTTELLPCATASEKQCCEDRYGTA
ncbi:MAG: 2Fe-2S iron-sulfur cluster binding domain-containing protein [Planctomycetes bacterium]|nr:2Fe-2S iron-sulfur cluster binding domain-containing protein [Planctomycetota bacterium]